MKRLQKFIALLAVVLAFGACSDEDVYVEPEMEVTPHNLAGTWRLAEWSGAALSGDSYVYLQLTRKDQLFTIYQNLDSFGARKLTGRYNLVDRDDAETEIRGLYDYGTGDWLHRYVVRNLTADRMVWIASDDPEDISVYERCTAVPDAILAEVDE